MILIYWVSLHVLGYNNFKTTSGLLLIFLNILIPMLMAKINILLTLRLSNYYLKLLLLLEPILILHGQTLFTISFNLLNLFSSNTPNISPLKNNLDDSTYFISNNFALQIILHFLNGITYHQEFLICLKAENLFGLLNWKISL